jgi:chemotaxis protein histidine kinase CheA
VDWSPIVNKQDEVEKILVSLRDITEVRRLKSVADQREEDIRILIELVQIPEEKFQRFLAKTKEYIAENRDIILNKSEPRSEIIRRLFMNMHTIKGAARTYSLKSISRSAHDVEQYYAALQRDEVEWNDGKLIADLDEVHRVLQQYQMVGEERLGWNSKENLVKISRAKLEQALHFLQIVDQTNTNPQQKQTLKAMTDHLGTLCFDPLQTLIEEASRGLDSLARDLKKQTPLIAMPQGLVLVKEKGADFLYSVLLHLFRNSMDHGIEAPEQRIQQGKAARGTISIDLKFEPDHLVLSYCDDGNGLDLIAIHTRGLDQGLIQATQNYTDNDIASLIFVSGFSTRNAVSEISGRGVGLNAVRTYCQDMAVAIDMRLESSPDRRKVPFRLELTLPRTFFWIARPQDDATAKAS